MNLQNKLYTIQFSHHLMTYSLSVPEQQSQNPKHMDFANVTKFQKNTKLLENSELLDKRGFKLTEMRKTRFLAPGQPPFIN